MKDKQIIFPDYNNCILNTINSILKYYKVKTNYNGLNELDKILKKQYKNIVLIILDGMGEHILKNISPNGFFNKNHLTTVTSVCPSTTTAAITTYYSGKPPIETGWIAMSQYFKEYGRAIEMLRKLDSYTGESISKDKIDIFDLIKYTPVYEQIEKASPEVKAYEINPTFCESRSKRNIKADTVENICDAIQAICENRDKNFILAYSDKPDTLLHKYGCTSNEVKEFVLKSEEQIKKMCKNLNKENTLVIVSADHGHKDIEKVYKITELEELQKCFIMPPTLESRAITFWIKEDKKVEFERIFKEKFNKDFMLFTKKEFLKKEFLGTGEQHIKIDDFIGNYIAISIGSSIIKLGTYLSKEKKDKKSTHCGFTSEEMEVPVIVI